MEKFENEIKKRLSQSRSMEGLDSEALWNSIAHSNSTVSSSKRSTRSRLAWLLSSLLFVGVVVAYIMNMQHAADHAHASCVLALPLRAAGPSADVGGGRRSSVMGKEMALL